MADLTTLAVLKERLGITGSNPADVPDAYLDNLIDRATGAIEAMAGRTLVSGASVTEYLDGNGTRILQLRHGPLDASNTTVSSVEYDSNRSETLTTVNAGDYFVIGNDTVWKLPSQLMAHGWAWTPGQQNYKAVFNLKVGATVPEELEEAALFYCVAMKNLRKDAATSGRAVGDGTVDFVRSQADILDEVRRMIAPYIPAM
jgi:hypothetical protein